MEKQTILMLNLDILWELTRAFSVFAEASDQTGEIFPKAFVRKASYS